MAGRLVTIEGLDGAGKTTLAAGLVSALAARGVEAVLLREPGGVELSERVRALVKDPALRVGGPAEALLYAAARAQLVEERVRPLLGEGSWVLLDRFVDSSLAYQGAARGLGVDRVRELNLFAHRRTRPGPDAPARPRSGGRSRAARGTRRGARPPRGGGRRLLRAGRRGLRGRSRARSPSASV